MAFLRHTAHKLSRGYKIPMSRRRKENKALGRNFGKPFGLAMFFVLVFALVYNLFIVNSDSLTPGDNEIIVAFLDVGQGDSILIWSRDNAVLIDGGEFARRDTVLRFLREAGITRLCYVIATHPHSDHIGGLVAVLSRLEVGQVLMPDVVHTTETFENFLAVIENNRISVTIPEPGQRYTAGIIDFTVLAPFLGHRNLNDASIVLRLQHGDTSFLFAGDMEAAGERMLLASGHNLYSDVLKVGHHGSRTSTTEAFLDAVAPVAAVIQVGENNRFGHPHSDVLERLYERGIAVYRTDLIGPVIMATNGERVVLLD